MRIDSTYNNYYVYTALYRDGTQTSCGACPVVWDIDEVTKKRELTWADGNYHLYDGYDFGEANINIVENAIYSALNGAAETFGSITLEDSDYVVHWCLLEESQVGVVLDFPQLLQAA